MGLPRREEGHNPLDLQRVAEGGEGETLRPHLACFPCVGAVSGRRHIEEVVCGNQPAGDGEQGGGVGDGDEDEGTIGKAYLTISPGRCCQERAVLPLYALDMMVGTLLPTTRRVPGTTCVEDGIAQASQE